jgi:hypothetical protein
VMILCDHCKALFRIPNHKVTDFLTTVMFCENCNKPAKFVFHAIMKYDPCMRGEIVDVGSEDT